jgi:Family of unknown function (DUF6134)
MIGRRTVLAGGTCLAAARPAAAALPVPPDKRLAFSIVRKGDVIGTHVLTFVPDGDRLTVHIAADIAVSLGPIVLFRYRHRATERWVGGQVVSLDSETNDDGTHVKARMWRNGGPLIVESTGHATYTAPQDAMPATHWNKAMLNGPFINTQNGKLMHPTVSPLGPAVIPGCHHEAWGFAMRGDADLDTWYDAAPCWVGLLFTGKDGTEVRYVRT